MISNKLGKVQESGYLLTGGLSEIDFSK